MTYLVKLSLIVWRLGLSGRGAKLVLGAVACVVAAAHLSSVFSLRQPGTVAMDVGISAYKLLGVLLALIWVQELISRDLDRKSILLPLACPLSRAQYLLSRFIGIWGMLLLVTVLMALGTALVAYPWEARYPHSVALGDMWHLAASFGLLFLDLTVVLAFAVAIASVATVQALPLLVGIAFAVVCRSIGPAVTFLTQVDKQHKWVSTEVHNAAGVVEWLLPDLSRFDLRGMVLYSDAVSIETMLLLAGVALSYSLLFLATGVFAFSRRDIV